MLSVAAQMACTFSFGLSWDIACIAAITDAPPPMSPFILPMPAPRFSEMPPLSKVIPLPTSQRLFPSFDGSPS